MSRNIAFVLIHGFGGNTSEVLPLAEHLVAQGYTVLCPALKGHTGNRKDLAGVSHQDWIVSAEDAYLSLLGKYDSIALVGFSTGGLIAANLALKHPIAALITISTPVYVWNLRQILLNMTSGSKKNKMESLKWYLFSATSFPLSALIHFQLLLHKTKALFPQISCPICVLQGLDDDTVNSKSASFIYNKVSSVKKELYFLDSAGHVVLKGPASKEAIRLIETFVFSNNLINQ